MNFQKYGSNGTDNKSANKLTLGLFVVYLFGLFWILLFKLGVQFSYMENRNVNLVPFGHGNIDVVEILLNVVIFVPLGIYAGVLFKRRNVVAKLFFFFLISTMFELLQFILRVGAFDVTDIITNTTGGIVGLMIFKGIERVFNNGVKTQKFINTLGCFIYLLQ